MCISISADKGLSNTFTVYKNSHLPLNLTVAKEHGVASRICEMFEERFGVYLAKAKEHTAYE